MDEKKLEEIQEAMREHQRKLETDPEYRKGYEKIKNWVETVGFGNDTED